MPLTEEIRKVFPYLFDEFGFVVLDEPEPDMVVIAQSGELRLRFIKDRANFFLDAGNSSAPDRWTGLYEILDNLKRKGRISLGYKYENKMKPLGSVLRESFPVVKEYVLAKS